MPLIAAWTALDLVVGLPVLYVSVELLTRGSVAAWTSGSLVGAAIAILPALGESLFRAALSWPSASTLSERMQVRGALWWGSPPRTPGAQRLLLLQVDQRLERLAEQRRLDRALLVLVAVGVTVTVGLLVWQPPSLPARLVGTGLLTAALAAVIAGDAWMRGHEREQLRRLCEQLQHEAVTWPEAQFVGGRSTSRRA